MRSVFRIFQIITIACLALIVANNFDARAPVHADRQVAPTYAAIYLGPSNGDTLLNEETRQQFRIAKANTGAALERHLQDHPETAVVYLHPQAITDIDALWLQQQYQRGVTIVAINTPITTLAALLKQQLPPGEIEGAVAPVTGLPIRTDAIIVSLLYPVYDEAGQAIGGWGWYSDYRTNFELMPAAINELLHRNHKR